MKILVLNCGSSSLKYQLIDMETEEVLASGKYERIGEKEAFITHKAQGKKVEIKKPAYDHKEAIEFTLAQLTNPEYKVIDSLDEVEAIGHRVVYPVINQTFFDCTIPDHIGKFCTNNGRVVFVYRDGTTRVTKGYWILDALREAGYREAGLFVPFSNGEEILNLALRTSWEKISK